MHTHGIVMSDCVIRPLNSNDRAWVARFIAERWGSTKVVAHDTVYYPHQLPGYVAIRDGERVGLVAYHTAGARCEIVTLDSTRPASGIGTALIAAVKKGAIEAGCQWLWLITTNDNLHALSFYQKRGFRLVTIHRDAVVRARRLKPEIPEVGADGIPLRDEIELEMPLASGTKRRAGW